MDILEIEITDGTNSPTRKLKSGTSIDVALELLQKLWEDDYLSLTYNLWVNGELHTSLETP